MAASTMMAIYGGGTQPKRLPLRILRSDMSASERFKPYRSIYPSIVVRYSSAKGVVAQYEITPFAFVAPGSLCLFCSAQRRQLWAHTGSNYALHQPLAGHKWQYPSMRCAASDHQESQPAVRKSAKWNSPECKVFISTCETVIAEGHRRGKCFSTKGWQRIAEKFNRKAGKNWTENPKYAKYKYIDCSEIYDTYGKLFGDTGDATKYALSPMKLSQCGFDLSTDSDRQDANERLPINTEYALSPTKLSQCGFDLSTDSDREDANDKLPINTKGTDFSGSPNLNRGNSSMNIFGRRSGEKRKGKQ
ncbi:Hypothetical predicted protein [Olea europaea subsp. europaea]|uniref:Myb/SANT-like domain-containing protein n=1 Tax=Olea europaea subsp. europaea TaxID=158383 RepID=A0A8S0SKC2_OLEEU|nr:Hypothetical predicted protein [Olea europaea subsp. europaea]